jgi:hypothetical protein
MEGSIGWSYRMQVPVNSASNAIDGDHTKGIPIAELLAGKFYSYVSM